MSGIYKSRGMWAAVCSILILAFWGVVESALSIKEHIGPYADAVLLESLAFLIPALCLTLMPDSKSDAAGIRLRGMRRKYFSVTIYIAIFVALANMLITLLTHLFVENILQKGVWTGSVVMPDDDGRMLFMLAVAIVPALFEELYLRGALLREFSKYGTFAAVAMSSMIFAMLHLSVYKFLGPMFAGIVFSLMVIHFRSVYPAIIAHFIDNFLLIQFGVLLENDFLRLDARAICVVLVILMLMFAYLSMSRLQSLYEEHGGAKWLDNEKPRESGFKHALIPMLIFTLIYLLSVADELQFLLQ